MGEDLQHLQTQVHELQLKADQRTTPEQEKQKEKKEEAMQHLAQLAMGETCSCVTLYFTPYL